MNNFLEYKGFSGTIEFSSEDDCFFGKIIGINDLITFEGKSVEEIKASFSESIDDYLEICEETGKQPEKSYKGSFNIRIDPVLHKKAAMLAIAANISLNQFVSSAISEKIQINSD